MPDDLERLREEEAKALDVVVVALLTSPPRRPQVANAMIGSYRDAVRAVARAEVEAQIREQAGTGRIITDLLRGVFND